VGAAIASAWGVGALGVGVGSDGRGRELKSGEEQESSVGLF